MYKERLRAATDLVEPLRESGELGEARQLGIETLATARRVFGDVHEKTLDVMT